MEELAIALQGAAGVWASKGERTKADASYKDAQDAVIRALALHRRLAPLEPLPPYLATGWGRS